jgi:hypothetical protein
MLCELFIWRFIRYTAENPAINAMDDSARGELTSKDISRSVGMCSSTAVSVSEASSIRLCIATGEPHRSRKLFVGVGVDATIVIEISKVIATWLVFLLTGNAD